LGEKLDRLITEGVIDADRANDLESAVVDKIEATPMDDIDAVIRFYLDISPDSPMRPEPDGAFL